MKPHRIDVVERVTADVLAALERGTIPWRQKWTPCGATMHRNAVSNRHYRGMNRITLPGVAAARGLYLSHYHKLLNLAVLLHKCLPHYGHSSLCSYHVHQGYL